MSGSPCRSGPSASAIVLAAAAAAGPDRSGGEGWGGGGGGGEGSIIGGGSSGTGSGAPPWSGTMSPSTSSYNARGVPLPPSSPPCTCPSASSTTTGRMAPQRAYHSTQALHSKHTPPGPRRTSSVPCAVHPQFAHAPAATVVAAAAAAAFLRLLHGRQRQPSSRAHWISMLATSQQHRAALY